MSNVEYVAKEAAGDYLRTGSSKKYSLMIGFRIGGCINRLGRFRYECRSKVINELIDYIKSVYRTEVTSITLTGNYPYAFKKAVAELYLEDNSPAIMYDESDKTILIFRDELICIYPDDVERAIETISRKIKLLNDRFKIGLDMNKVNEILNKLKRCSEVEVY